MAEEGRPDQDGELSPGGHAEQVGCGEAERPRLRIVGADEEQPGGARVRRRAVHNGSTVGREAGVVDGLAAEGALEETTLAGAVPRDPAAGERSKPQEGERSRDESGRAQERGR